MVLIALLTLVQDKTYELKFRSKPFVGRKVEVDQKESQDTRFTVSSEGKVVQEQKNRENYRFVGTEEVLKVDGDKILESKWLFSKAVKIEEGKETPLGFQGKTVIASQNDDGARSFKYEDGKALEGEDLKALNAALGGKRKKADVPNPEEVFLPKKAVKVGESWVVDVEKVAKGFGWEADALEASKCKASVTLKAVQDRGGVEFGTIEAALEIHLKKLGPMSLETPLVAKITLGLEASVDGRIPDGIMTLRMEMQGKSAAKVPDADKTLDVDVEMKAENVMTRKSLK